MVAQSRGFGEGSEVENIADVFARHGAEKTGEYLERLASPTRDMIDLEAQAAAELEPGVREKLAYANENIVPLLARISPAGMQDATADIVADRVKLKKNYLNEAIKDETQRQKAAVFEALLRQAEPAAEE